MFVDLCDGRVELLSRSSRVFLIEKHASCRLNGRSMFAQFDQIARCAIARSASTLQELDALLL